MRLLSRPDAQRHLNGVRMDIGSWNQLQGESGNKCSSGQYVKISAPQDVLSLRNFSQSIYDWLATSEWKIVQIDNSTALTTDGAELLGRLLSPSLDVLHELTGCTFLFEFEDVDDNCKEEGLLVGLI